MWIHFISTAYQPIPVINAFWELVRKEKTSPNHVYLLYPDTHSKNLNILKNAILEIQHVLCPNTTLSVEFLRFSDAHYEEIIDRIKEKILLWWQKTSNNAFFTSDITGGGKPIALSILQLANDLDRSGSNLPRLQRIYYLLMNGRTYMNELYPFIPFKKQELITLWPKKKNQ